VQPINSLEALHSIELQCQTQVAHDPEHTGCIQGVTGLYKDIRDPGLASRWNAWVITHVPHAL
jgi:hypothetical protein